MNAIKSVITTGGTAQDWIAVAMLLTPAGGKGKNALQNNITDTPNNKKTPTETDTSNNKKNDENASVKPKNTTFDTENQNKKGEAYAEGGDAPIVDKSASQKQSIEELKPNSVFRDSNGRLRNSDGTFAKDPETKGKNIYRRNKAERKRALLRDADDPSSDLSQEARDYIKKHNGDRVPENYEVSHEKPLYTRKTNEGKAEIDIADNMKTQPKQKHRARHRICGDQYHQFGPSNKPKILK